MREKYCLLYCAHYYGTYFKSYVFFVEIHLQSSFRYVSPEQWHCTILGVSRGKGQDLFLRSFYESLQIIQEKKLQVPSLHAVVVGSDMNAQTKFETELRNFVVEKRIHDRVHFVNKTLNVSPYLASIDVLVQNSQVLSANSPHFNALPLGFKR